MKEKIKKCQCCDEMYQQGFRIGIGVMLMFVVPTIIIGLLDLPEWKEALIFSVFFFPTLIWLVSRNN